jgi:hypothetical protein
MGITWRGGEFLGEMDNGRGEKGSRRVLKKKGYWK